MPTSHARQLVSDLMVAATVAAFFFLIAWFTDLAEHLGQLLRDAEHVELDEILIVSIALVPMLLVVVWRQQVRVARVTHLSAQAEATKKANVALQQEIVARVAVEESLREAAFQVESHLREIQAIYETAPIGLCSVDRDLRFTRINSRLADMNGIPPPDHIGRPLPELLPHLADRLVPMYRSVLDTGRPLLNVEFAATMPADPAVERSWILSYYPLADSAGAVVGVNGIVIETTERRQVEKEARRITAEIERVQKLEGLDVLVGGIAHDFNNLLMAILANLELALDEAGLPGPAADCLREAERAGLRAADVCRELLTYTGRSRPVFELFNLNGMARGVVQMLRSTTAPGVTIAIRDWPEKLLVEGDESQITQVVVNLVINATHAIGDRDGRVTLALAADADAGTARLTCADTGCGMDEATAARVFEPFFTTKPNGRGLGLAAAKGILKRHRGELTVESAPGVGSTFTMTLPLAKVSSDSEIVATPPPRAAAERVFLVVDDDPIVRRATVAGLVRRGAAVIEAPGGEAACDLAAADARPLAGCLIDYHMPGLNGAETYRRLRERYPAVPMVIISGNLLREAEDVVLGDRLATTLQKPYSITEALEVIDGLGRAGA